MNVDGCAMSPILATWMIWIATFFITLTAAFLARFYRKDLFALFAVVVIPLISWPLWFKVFFYLLNIWINTN